MAKTGFYQSNTVVEETESDLSPTATSAGDNSGKPKSSFYSQNSEYEDVQSTTGLVEAAQAAATAAQTAQAAAEAAQAAAETAETNAETAETNAETAETNAETAQTAAEAAQAAAETAQGLAEAAQSGAETAETNAETAEANAEAAQSAAETAQVAAETAQGLAETAQAAAESSATAAETAEGNAADSAAAAATSESNAADSETAAAASASAAATAETNAETAQTAAEAAQAAAETAETNAETAETNAEAAQAAAEAAQTAAETAETNAETAETNAEAAQAAAEAAYDSFDDRYLGAKASDPTLDNDGDALLTGALYWNTSASNLRIYDGATWQVYSASGGASAFLDLSDTPSDYSGQGDKLVAVNSGATALEFITAPTPISDAADLTFNPSGVVNSDATDVQEAIEDLDDAIEAVEASIPTPVIPSGHLAGLKLSNNTTDSTNDIDIAPGSAVDDTGTVTMVLASSLTKRLDATFTAGTGNGMRDGGSIANDWWHIFLIAKANGADVDIVAANDLSPTMPTDYIYKRRIGSILRTGGAIKFFTQIGDYFYWQTRVQDVSTSNFGTSAVNVALTVPTEIAPIAIINLTFADYSASRATTNEYAYVRALAETNPTPALDNCDIYLYSNFFHQVGSVNKTVGCNTSGQVAYRVSLNDANIFLFISTLGYIDYRDK